MVRWLETQWGNPGYSREYGEIKPYIKRYYANYYADFRSFVSIL